MDPQQQRLPIILGLIMVALLLALIFVLLNDRNESSVADSTPPIDDATSSTVGPEGSTTSAAPEAAVTTAAAGATAAPPPPSGDACSGLPGATIPGPEPGVTFADGDFDGDGSLDQLIGYQDAGGTWWVQMAFSYGYATQSAVFGPVTALGAQDFGGGGQDVGFAYVDSGASTQLVGFFFAPGCDIFEVTITGTAAVARFPIGGGVMHLDGMFCTFDGFTTTSATTNDGISWGYTTTDYVWVPGLLEFEPVASSISVLTSPADDATIFAASSFDCPLLAP